MKPAASWETRRRVFSNMKRQQVDVEPAFQVGFLFLSASRKNNCSLSHRENLLA